MPKSMGTHHVVRRSRLSALALLAAGVAGVVVPAAPVAAQDYTNVTASGRVVDGAGKGIPRATVTVTSNAQGFSRTVTTDGSGGYRIPQLPIGSYTYSISADGFTTFTDPAVALSQDTAGNQFQLAAAGGAAGSAGAVANSGDAIVVTGRRVRVADFDRTTTGAVVDIGSLATRVPVARDITSVVLLSPGTVSGDTAFGNLPSVNGGSVSENVYYINGLNITQFRNGLGAVTVPFEFYQTVETKNGGFQAEFGRSTGGVVNSTSKSGSNEFHGSVTFNFEPNELAEDAPNTYASDNDNDYRSRNDTILQLSGPLIKDRLFFYGLVNFRDVQTRDGSTAVLASGTGQSTYKDFQLGGTNYIIDRSTSPFFGGKLDGIITDGHRVEFTYFDTSGKTTRDIFGTSVFPVGGGRYNPGTNDVGRYASSTVFRSGGENYVGRYTGTFAPWITLSGAYGVNKNTDTTESNTPDLSFISDQRGGTTVSVGNVTANSSTNFDKRTFYRGDVDLYFQLAGAHHVRGGYDREDLNLDSVTRANGGSQITYARTPASGIDAEVGTAIGANADYAKVRSFVSGGTFKTRNEAFYLQDSWSLFGNRLSLNIGVRNDRFNNRNADGVSFFKSGSQWAPRLGFAFDAFGDGTTKLYGSFGRYYLPVAVNTNVRLAGSELDYDQFFRLTGVNPDNTPILGAQILIPNGDVCPGGTQTSCVIRNDGTVPGTATTVASNLKPQSADEYIIGAERRIGQRIRVGLFATQRKLNDSLEDAALDPAIRKLCVGAGNTQASCDAIYNGVHQYGLINPGRDVVITLSDPFPNQTTAGEVTLAAADLGYPRARRTYRAITATFDRDFDGKWELHGNYTYSKSRGNIEGGIRSDNAQTDSGLTTAFDLPALVNGSYGYLPGDARHNIKLYGSYQLTDWFNFGANIAVTSPRRFGCLGRVPAQADGNLAGRFYGAAGFYCNLDADGNVRTTGTATNPLPGQAGTPSLQLTPRGSQFKSDWTYLTNVDLTFKVPADLFVGFLRISAFNVLNLKSKRDFQELGTTDAGAPLLTYGQPLAYQQPRYIRAQLSVGF